MRNSVVEAEFSLVAGRTALDEEQFATSLLRDLGRRTFSSAAITFCSQGIQATPRWTNNPNDSHFTP